MSDRVWVWNAGDVPGRWSDLERPPLRAAALRRALAGSLLGHELVVLPSVGSTNASAAERARAGAAEGLVVTAEEQTTGRGRLARGWSSPPRAGLYVSVLLRPSPVLRARWAWLPLLAGVALVDTVRAVAECGAALKWPNDLLVGDPPSGKAAGLLAEVVGDAVVLGIGLNVTTRRDELPRDDTTSLALAGAAVLDRDTLLRALLRALADRYTAWRDAGGDATTSGLATAYREVCATTGQRVRVSLPGGTTRTGAAVDVDDDGRLVVAADDGERLVLGAGDVVHVRPEETA